MKIWPSSTAQSSPTARILPRAYSQHVRVCRGSGTPLNHPGALWEVCQSAAKEQKLKQSGLLVFTGGQKPHRIGSHSSCGSAVSQRSHPDEPDPNLSERSHRIPVHRKSRPGKQTLWKVCFRFSALIWTNMKVLQSHRTSKTDREEQTLLFI